MPLHHAFESRGLEGIARLAIYTAEGVPMSTAGPAMGQYIRGELARRAIGFHPQKTTARVDEAAQRAVRGNGYFFEMPYPVMETRSPDAEQFRDTLDWVGRHLHPIR